MVFTEAELEEAEARMRSAQASSATAVNVRYDRRIGRVVIHLNSGLDVAFSPHDVQGLERAKPVDLDTIEITPSGLGIHFPKLDADVYLPTLSQGFTGSQAWMAAKARARRARKRTGSAQNVAAGIR